MGHWYFNTDKEVKKIIEQELKKNVFVNDTFETEYVNLDGSAEELKQDLKIDSGGVQPDEKLKRCLSIEDRIDVANISSSELRRVIGSPLSTQQSIKNDKLQKEFQTVKDRIQESARNYRGAAQGSLIADRYGKLKFKEYDPSNMDTRPMSGASRYNLRSQYEEKVPSHVKQERKYLVSPAFQYAHNITQKYLKTAPMAFQVQRPAKVHDLTMSVGPPFDPDRKIQQIRMDNPDMNQLIAE